MTHNGKKYKTKGGRPVFGGGGISPDIYVAVDSSEFLPRENKQQMREIIGDAAYYYFLSNRTNLQKIKTPAELQQSLSTDPVSWQFLKAKAIKDSINLDTLPAKQQQVIQHYFTIMLGRQLWHTDGYVKMKNLSDPLITKALEEIRK